MSEICRTNLSISCVNICQQNFKIVFCRMQDLNHKLQTMVTNRETLERLCYTMRDEISEVSNKVDNQSLEIKDVQGALRVQSKMFETQATKMVSFLF